MIAAAHPRDSGVARFRAKLLIAMMLIVSVITAVALVIAQHSVATAVESELQREFQREVTSLHNIRELRQAALVERCRGLVRKPRIHAALEDDALDLLYPSAQDELRDLMTGTEEPATEAPRTLHAEFYRFLQRDGRVIPATGLRAAGFLRPEEEAQLALPKLSEQQQLGYLMRHGEHGEETMTELIAMPIISSETGEVVAALVLGFKPAALPAAGEPSGISRGIWLAGRVHLDGLNSADEKALAGEVDRAIATAQAPANNFRRAVGGVPHLLFYERLNGASFYPPAYEVVVYPLTHLRARQWALRWRVLAAGTVLLLGALAASNYLAGALSKPVERLAVDSAENFAQRRRAEAALELTSEELQRAARFSADASHQLKTPVTVLRAGLEELLAREHLSPEECNEISALIHQTYRLSSVIEDLLLLSRMDAGRLKIDFGTIDLSHMIEAALDDFGAQPNPLGLTIATDFPRGLEVAGEKRYLGIILQNLIENARKYNRAGGQIHIAAGVTDDRVRLSISNTGRVIPAAAQAHIFERFHRGEIGENVPGYGLGLNLARELARLHRGDLRLVRSDEAWTEFEVTLLAAGAVPATEIKRV